MRCLVAARGAAATTSRGSPVEIAVGDLTDPPSLARGARPASTTLYHVAADYRLWARDPPELYRANAGGTENLLGGGRAGRRLARRLHELGRGPRPDRRRHAGRRDDAGRARDDHRPLQEVEVRRRARGRGLGGAGPAGRHRQPVDAGRRARHQADADRPDDRGLPEPAAAGLRRHRAEPHRRARRRRRPPRRGRARTRRASDTSSATAT